MARLAIPKDVLRDLSIACKNQCAFPGCDRPILTPSGVYVGELCHIEAAEPGGPRFNPNQSDEDRTARGNLFYMCHEHHKVTDDVNAYSVARLKEMKAKHEALPAVVFNSDLLLQEVQKVLATQDELSRLLQRNQHAFSPGQNFPVKGPFVKDAWIPDQGRFYSFSFPNGSKLKFMMRDGWVHIEQTLPDGSKAYYEVNEKGDVRQANLPHPLAEYTIEIPPSMIMRRELVKSEVGDRAVQTWLKWSAGSVVEHFVGSTLVGFDCHARCRIDNSGRRISVIPPPGTDV